MTLILSGTNGLSDVDGDASTPAVRGTDANSGIFFGADTVGVSTGGSEKVSVGASAVIVNDGGADVDFRVEGDTDANLLFVDAGNDRVGVGTSSPSGKLTVAGAGGSVGSASLLYVNVTSSYGGINVNATSGNNAFYELYEGGSKVGAFAADATANTTAVQADGGHALTFNTAGTTERMRIDSSGNLLVGATGNPIGSRIYSEGSGSAEALGLKIDSSNSLRALSIWNAATTGQRMVVFLTGTGPAVAGSIECASTTTSYLTSSDYRLKENIAPMTGALAKVLELNPVTYTWKEDGSAGQGFIAHELQEVAPHAVSGEKDGEEMQGVDYGKITPLLTAALQEAIAEIQSLKARVAELEAK